MFLCTYAGLNLNYSGFIFYKKLSETLGNRLLYSYTLTSQFELSTAYGMGQLQELAESE